MTDDELTRVIKEHIRKRNEGSDEKFLFGSERVDLRKVAHLAMEARKRDFAFVVDEPPERGGTDKGPNPLAYFIAGAASCLMNQYAALAIARGISIDRMELTARGHFDRRIGGAFEEIVYELRLDSPASEKEVLDLSKEAERMCYAHNTLKKAGVRMVTELSLNGRKIPTA